MVDTYGSNILHWAVFDPNDDAAVAEEKVLYICRQYPTLVHQLDSYGHTPQHNDISHSMFIGATSMCLVRQQAVRD